MPRKMTRAGGSGEEPLKPARYPPHSGCFSSHSPASGISPRIAPGSRARCDPFSPRRRGRGCVICSSDQLYYTAKTCEGGVRAAALMQALPQLCFSASSFCFSPSSSSSHWWWGPEMGWPALGPCPSPPRPGHRSGWRWLLPPSPAAGPRGPAPQWDERGQRLQDDSAPCFWKDLSFSDLSSFSYLSSSPSSLSWLLWGGTAGGRARDAPRGWFLHPRCSTGGSEGPPGASLPGRSAPRQTRTAPAPWAPRWPPCCTPCTCRERDEASPGGAGEGCPVPTAGSTHQT